MLWQPFDYDIGSVKLDQIRQEKKMSKLKNLVVIFNHTYMTLKASVVLCSVNESSTIHMFTATCDQLLDLSREGQDPHSSERGHPV